MYKYRMKLLLYKCVDDDVVNTLVLLVLLRIIATSTLCKLLILQMKITIMKTKL